MGTIPGREEILEVTLASLIDQDVVDNRRVRINVHHKQYPDWEKWDKNGSSVLHTRVHHTHASSPEEDPGDCSKMIWADRVSGYYFSCDDDIVYPPDYLSRMIDVIEAHERRVLVCVHAINIIDPNFTYGYYDRRTRQVFNTSHALATTQVVHEPGAGTMAFHAGTLDLSLADFPSHGMCDVHAAIWAKRNHVQVVAIARPAGWCVGQETPDSIWHMNERARQRGEEPDAEQTRRMKEAGPWV
jgi:hypothetical protein